MGAGATLSMVAAGLFAPLVLALGLGTAAAAEPDLKTLLDLAGAAGRNGEPVGRVSFAQATSPSLLRGGEIDFPVSFDIDLAIDAQPSSLHQAVTAPVSETGRYVVVFDVALAKASRKVRDVKESDRPSQRVVEIIRHDNPAYRLAYKDLEKAAVQADVYTARGRPAPTRIAQRLEAAQDRLAATPKHLEQPVYGAYNFRLADVEARKTMTVNFLVIDKIARRYFKSVFDIVENQPFWAALNIDPSDPNKDRIHSDYSFEKDIRDWERAPVVPRLSDILGAAAAREGTAKPYANPDKLLAELVANRNAAVARAEAERYDERPLDDPRFDSVVAIYDPVGAMGSGFFVRPNIVMTNWHVVENHPIVELQLYDRRETFGQVIAKDVRLDLALVKVQDRGRPVEFYRGKGLRPGDAVDLIGHPRRHLFSITRGIVSAIRRDGEDGDDGIRGPIASAIRGTEHRVMYVQTDAEGNPGNSGGPLFSGNKVVGVCVLRSLEKLHGSKNYVQNPGLNFSIHYAEAERFLQDALKGE